MINTSRIPIRRSIIFPSFPWLWRRRERTDSRSEAEKASAFVKGESFANRQRDTAHAEFFLMGGRRFY
jgi:hypothetical protein